METTIEIDQEFRSKQHLQNEIDSVENDISDDEQLLFALIMATPKDITPIDNDPISYLTQLFREYMESYRDNIIKSFKLDMLKYDDNNGLT